MVAVYHYAWFWTPTGRGDALLPYGDALAWLPLAAQGHLGVHLFFILSGFVITLSLDRAPGAGSFALRRLIRLWPGLLIAGILTWGAVTAFGPDSLRRSGAETLISLVFFPPAYVGRLLNEGGWQWLDGAYWSLWTEVRFYALAALFHFATRGRFVTAWTLFALASAAVLLVAHSGVGGADAVSRLLFARYQPFFTGGIALAVLARGGGWPAALLLVASSGWATGIAALEDAPTAEILLIPLLFALAASATLMPRCLPVLAAQPVALIGRASYLYYLLHQSFGIALLTGLGLGAPGPAIAAMLGVQAGILALSVGLHVWVEVPVMRRLRRRLADVEHPGGDAR